MLFEDNSIDLTFLNLANIKDTSMYEKCDGILPAKEGFLKGNMFKNEYEPYKNYTYMDLVPKTEKEAKLFNVMQYSFAINDLNLYLDLHPDNREAFNMLKKMIECEKLAKAEYVKEYGPIVITNVNRECYDWLDSWPWENLGGSMYV